MKIRNLLILVMTMALGALSAAAQERDGSVTYTDDSKQSITISRFGTVLSFRNSNGKETVPSNVYRVCLCGQNSPCVESATVPSKEISSKFEVEVPKLPRQGAMIKKGQTLVVTATFRQDELAVKRRLTWEAGFSSVIIDDTISASKPLRVCTLAVKATNLAMKMCPGPPGFSPDCPPGNTNEMVEKMYQFLMEHRYDFSN